MRGLRGIHPVAWVLVGMVAVASWACSSAESGSPAREAAEAAETAETAETADGDARPSSAVPEGAEREAWQAADRELFPDDIRDDLGGARRKTVAWVGVVEQTEMTQYEDRFSMAATVRHHYFDWRASGDDGKLRLSEAGEGLFRVVWTLPKGPSVVTPQDAWEYGRPGLLLFAYGEPVGVKQSVVTLRVKTVRVEPQDSYVIDGEYVRPGGSPLVGTRWRLVALGLDGVPPELEITVEWGEDGALAGGAGCNRFSGTYTVFGEDLTIGPLATTRMACEPEAMVWEQRVLDALGAVTRHERNARQLLLHGATPEARLRLRPLVPTEAEAGDEGGGD